MALLNGKNAVSLTALLAFGLVTAPGGSVRLGDALTIDLPAIGSAQAATKKRTVKKKAASKKVASTKRVCTTKKVKGKLVKSCKTVKIIPALPLLVPPPPAPVVIVPKIEWPSVYTVPAVQAVAPPRPAPPAQPPASSFFQIDLADSLAGAIGDAPPDFVVRYDRIDSWVWLSRSGEMLIVEPGREGIVQYYFRSGASAPYLVRDTYNSYAFSGPELAQVYDDRGRLFMGQLSWRQADDSRNLFDRGRALFSASWRQRGWSGDSAVQWYDTMRGSSGWSWQSGWRGNWGGDWRRRSDWQSFEYDQFSQMPPRYLDDERQRRRDSTYRYDRWRRDGAHGAPPPTANPVIPNPAPVSPGEAGPPPPTPAPAPAPTPRPRPRPPMVTPPPAPAPAPAPAPTPQPGWREPIAPPTISTEPEPRPPEFERRRPRLQPAPQPAPPPLPAPVAAPVQVEQSPAIPAPPPPPAPAPEVIAPPPPPPAPAAPAPAPPPVPAATPEPPANPDVPETVDDGSARLDPVNEQRP